MRSQIVAAKDLGVTDAAISSSHRSDRINQGPARGLPSVPALDSHVLTRVNQASFKPVLFPFGSTCRIEMPTIADDQNAFLPMDMEIEPEILVACLKFDVRGYVDTLTVELLRP